MDESNVDEFIIIKTKTCSPNLNIINFYGTYEGRTSQFSLSSSWKKLVFELEKIEKAQEHVIILGDFNCHIGADSLGIIGNKETISYGGHLVRSLISSGSYFIANNHHGTSGGPWTWSNAKGTQKSALDLVICSSSLSPFIEEILIDSNRICTPKSVYKSTNKIVFTDHYAIFVKLKNLPGRPPHIKKSAPVWNFSKPGGWLMFHDLTNKKAEEIYKLTECRNLSNEDIMSKVKAIEKKILFSSFGKITIKNSSKLKTNSSIIPQSNAIQSSSSKSEAYRLCSTDTSVMSEESLRLEKEILKMKFDKQSNLSKIFKLRKKILGIDVNNVSSVKDPDSDIVYTAPEEIKSYTLKYCVDNLQKSPPEDHPNNLVYQSKSLLNESRLRGPDVDPKEITMHDFNKVLDKYKTKSTKIYDLILKAGNKYKEAIFHVCRRFYDSEEFPSSFWNVLLFMIYKGSGPRELLYNSRFIHRKEELLARIIDSLTALMIKDSLVDSSSMFQIGGQEGHEPEEHVFSIKVAISNAEENGDAFILLIIDAKSFFDKINIEDATDALYSVNADSKATRIWNKLNNDIQIRVRSSAGLSNRSSIGPSVGQGSATSTHIAQSVMDRALQSIFHKDEDSIRVGNIPIDYLAFQDDVGKMVTNVCASRKALIKIDSLYKEKKWPINYKKTGVIVFGDEKKRNVIIEELKVNPLFIGNQEVKLIPKALILGQVVHQDGLEASIVESISSKKGKVERLSREISQLIDDFRMQSLGGLNAARYLWESIIIPSLLYGANTWISISDSSITTLNNIQDGFWKTIFRISNTTPKISLRTESKSLNMKYRIMIQKISFARRLRSKNGSLAKELYEQQTLFDSPGLHKEIARFDELLGIDTINSSKNDVKKAVLARNHEDNRVELAKLKKTKHLVDENVPDYFKDTNILRSRMSYRVRVNMVPSIKTHFKGSFKDDLLCNDCLDGQESTLEHIKVCTAWINLRKDSNLDILNEFSQYIINILKIKSDM